MKTCVIPCIKYSVIIDRLYLIGGTNIFCVAVKFCWLLK